MGAVRKWENRIGPPAMTATHERTIRDDKMGFFRNVFALSWHSITKCHLKKKKNSTRILTVNF